MEGGPIFPRVGRMAAIIALTVPLAFAGYGAETRGVANAPASGVADKVAPCLVESLPILLHGPWFNPPVGVLPGEGALLVDQNIIQAIVANRDGIAKKAGQAGYERVLREIEARTGLARSQILNRDTEHSYLWVTEQVAKEYRDWPNAPGAPRGIRRAALSADRATPEFQSVVKILEGANVGGAQGAADRVVVAEAYFARTEDGSTPTFMTLDKKIYNHLCRLSPACGSSMGRRAVYLTHPNGFEVSLRDSAGVLRTIRVIPVPPK